MICVKCSRITLNSSVDTFTTEPFEYALRVFQLLSHKLTLRPGVCPVQALTT